MNAQAVAQSASAITTTLNQLTNLNLPIGWEFTPLDASCFPPDAAKAPVVTPTVEGLSPTATALPPTATDIPLPVTEVVSPTESAPSDSGATTILSATAAAVAMQCDSQRNLWLLIPGHSPNWFGLFLRKVIGVAVTVIAIGQGAPFWFDLIRRLVNPSSG
ncbi:MAG: hypothetical protein ABI700_17540 [Chloroflexota bacterium]